MDIAKLSDTELQQAVLLHGKNFHRFLGVSYAEGRKVMVLRGLKNPTTYVRELAGMALGQTIVLSQLRTLGTWKKVAEHYSVSESFLRSCFLGRDELEGERSSLGDMPVEEFKSEIERLGSVALFARVHIRRESHVREYAKKNGVELSTLISYEGEGFENAKGRKAELYFAEQRGALILKDFNTEEGSQAEHDFLDERLGTVNVKSSQEWKYKAKTRKNANRYWKFSVDGVQKSQTVAFVLMDEKFDKVVGWFSAPTSLIPEEMKTLTVNEVVLKKLVAMLPTGRFLMEQDFIKYVIKGEIEELVPVDSLRGNR